jgi:hypothetical protein
LPDGSFELLVCLDKHAYNVLSWQQHLAERPLSIATAIKKITGTLNDAEKLYKHALSHFWRYNCI